MSRLLTWRHRGKPLPVRFEQRGAHFVLTVGERSVEAEVRREGAWVDVRLGETMTRCAVAACQRGVWVACEGASYLLEHERAAPAKTEGSADELRAPMTGRVVAVTATEGASVTEGEVLVTIEAMKMEFRVVAPEDGVVLETRCRGGDRVELGDLLVLLKPAGGGGAPAEGRA